MCTLPAPILLLLNHFAPVFSERVWEQALVVVVGALLAPGAGTVMARLRAGTAR